MRETRPDSVIRVLEDAEDYKGGKFRLDKHAELRRH